MADRPPDEVVPATVIFKANSIVRVDPVESVDLRPGDRADFFIKENDEGRVEAVVQIWRAGWLKRNWTIFRARVWGTGS